MWIFLAACVVHSKDNAHDNAACTVAISGFTIPVPSHPCQGTETSASLIYKK